MTNNDDKKKGFGGFADLVTDISKDIELPTQKNITVQIKNTSSPPPQPVQQTNPSTPTSTQTKDSKSPLPSSPGSAWAWWIIGIVFVLYFLSENSNNITNTPEISADENIAFNSESTLTTDMTDADSSSDVPPDINHEENPPIGTGLLLSQNQIRYCLSENIRLTTIKKALDKYSDYEIGKFNSATEDYNSRCSNYKYTEGLLEIVQNEVNLNNANLVIDALSTLDSWRETSAVLQQTPAIAPPNLRDTQKHLEPLTKKTTSSNSSLTTTEDTEINESNIPLQKKYSNLFESVQSGDIEETTLMLKAGANPNIFSGAYPPLISAIYLNNTNLVELLLKNGADPNCRNSRGESAILIAKTMQSPNAEIINHLYVAGADPFLK